MDIQLEVHCTKCYGNGRYYEEATDETVDCDCLNGTRPSELGQAIIDLVVKYTS